MDRGTTSRTPSDATPAVSACVISFNEERNIRDCLESVSWCDEVIVLDSYSEDRTPEIARELGAQVLQEPWEGHVRQKNKAIAAARNEWILTLDCDERITEKLRDKILAILGQEQRADGYYISRKLRYLGRWLEHGGWFPEWRMRLFRAGRGIHVGVDPHDVVEVDGPTARIDPGGRGEDAAVILHYSFRDLSHQLKVLDRYSEIMAGELYRRGRRTGAFDLLARPAWRFLYSYFVRAGFLDGAAGYHMAINHAYGAYMKYSKLWEIQRGLVELRDKTKLVPTREEEPIGGEASQEAVS